MNFSNKRKTSYEFHGKLSTNSFENKTNSQHHSKVKTEDNRYQNSPQLRQRPSNSLDLETDQSDCSSSGELTFKKNLLAGAYAARYEKQRILILSIYGSIWYAKDVVTGEHVVVKESNLKVIHRMLYHFGEGNCEDVLAEIKIHQQLSRDKTLCPYIIQLKEVWQDDVNVNMVLEYAEGDDLFEHAFKSVNGLLAKKRGKELSEDLSQWQNNVRRWFKQLLVSLNYMHTRNICHRDMSLENVVLKGGDVKDVRIIDFGLAYHYADRNFKSENSRVGKTYYMSPECHAGQHYDGRANDVWCLGVMLFTCLTGFKPWRLPSNCDANYRHITHRKGVKSFVRRFDRDFLLTDDAVDLITKIFKPEYERISVNDALRHPFITGLHIYRTLDLYITPEDSLEPQANGDDVRRVSGFKRKQIENTPLRRITTSNNAYDQSNEQKTVEDVRESPTIFASTRSILRSASKRNPVLCHNVSELKRRAAMKGENDRLVNQ